MNVTELNTRILFILNEKSGNSVINYDFEIENFFKSKSNYSYSIIRPEWSDAVNNIRNAVQHFEPKIVVAIGGDGTINLVSQIIYGKNIILGIIPAGSANGLAKDLNIPIDIVSALDVIINGNIQLVSSVLVNDKLCIHLSDIGLNAQLVKQFEFTGIRGLKGYFRAAWRLFKREKTFNVTIRLNAQTIYTNAVMVVIANATKYGTGYTINPDGRIDDYKFEIIVMKNSSLKSLIKMLFTNALQSLDEIEIYSCQQAQINTDDPINFQIDGEFIGKVKQVDAMINNQMMQVLVPNSLK